MGDDQELDGYLSPAWDDEPQGDAPGFSDHDLSRVAFQGMEALELENHPAFQGALSSLERSLFAQWTASGLTSTEEREAIYRQYNALMMLKGALSERVRQGQLAAESMRQL